jgi:hypothetical protein
MYITTVLVPFVIARIEFDTGIESIFYFWENVMTPVSLTGYLVIFSMS